MLDKVKGTVFWEREAMKLYVARHGETGWNVQNRVCGLTDVELTERGRAQAKELSKAVGKLHVDLILASPLKRAVETGRIIAEENGIPMELEELLVEQNYGIYEGTDRRNPAFLANKRNFAYRYPGGESMMQVAYRVYGLIDRVKEQYPGKNILFVCHGGVCRVLNTYFRDMTNEEFFQYSQENCGIEEYELNETADKFERRE